MSTSPVCSVNRSVTVADTATCPAGHTVPKPRWDHRLNTGSTRPTDNQDLPRNSRRMCMASSVDGIRKTATNLLHHVSNGLRRVLRYPFRLTPSSNVSDLSAGASIELLDWSGSMLSDVEVDTKKAEDVFSPARRAGAHSHTDNAINTVPARYIFGRARNNTHTSTPPEICFWLSTFLIGQEIHWIIRHSGSSANTHLLRIASCLQRAHHHLYDVAEEDYPHLQLPPGATGHKLRYCTHAMGSKRPTYPRGAKGLKKFGDPDIPSTRWTPNGIKLQPFDYQMLRLRGCFFPAPSKLRHVETLSYEAELENGLEHHDASSNALQKTSPGRSSSSSLPAAWNELEDVSQSHQHLFGPNADHQNITSQPIAGEEPMDYYGPARDYAGSVSSGSDSWSDSDTDGTHNMDIESGFAGSLGAFATETKACDSDTDIDSMSIDLPDSDSEAHDPEGFGIIQGQNVPQVTLRPASIAQMADIMYAIDDELDHDEVRSSRHLSLLPPLPEDYRYLVTPTMAFCRKPYLVVPATSRRFDI